MQKAIRGVLGSAYNGIILKGYCLTKRLNSNHKRVFIQNYDKQITLNQMLIQGSCFKKSKIKKCYLKAYFCQMLDHYQRSNMDGKILFTLNPNHQLLRSSIHDCKSILTQEDLKMIQSLNKSNCRLNLRQIFLKRSKTQSIEYKKTLSQIKTVNKQNKVKQKKQQLKMLIKQIQEKQQS